MVEGPGKKCTGNCRNDDPSITHSLPAVDERRDARIVLDDAVAAQYLHESIFFGISSNSDDPNECWS